MNNVTNKDPILEIINNVSIVRMYSIGILFIFGIAFNIMCIFIFLKLESKISLNIVHLTGLSVSNIVKLGSEFIFPFIEFFHPSVLNHFLCQSRNWFKFTSGEMCSWLIIFISIERIYILKNKMPTVQNGKHIKSLLAIFVSFTFFGVLNSSLYATQMLISVKDKTTNKTKCSYQLRGINSPIFSNGVFNYTYLWTLYGVFYSLLPFFILITTNLLIFKILKQMKKSKMNAKKFREANENARILLLLSFFFIVSSLPTQLTNILNDVFYYSKSALNNISIAYYVLITFECVNNCFNIFIFVVINNKLRTQFVLYFLGCFSYKKYINNQASN